jgi:G6PDH family F420-dependent oxidoreductase
LLENAVAAEAAGFDSVFISDHFQPWMHDGGHAPAALPWLGALGARTSRILIGTSVLTPTFRYHPAVVAQAIATLAVMNPGRVILGVGTGEALNEVTLGLEWPEPPVRFQRLKESIALMRELWDHERVTFEGSFWRVEDATVYDRPDEPVPVYIGAAGPAAARLAGRIGDGFITTKPSAEDVQSYRDAGGTGPVHAGTKVCWAPDREQAVDTAHRLWANSGVPGELSQVLPTPQHFEQVSELVTREAFAEKGAFGPDAGEHVQAYAPFVDAGFDEVYVANMGPHYADMLAAYGSDVLPELRRS